MLLPLHLSQLLSRNCATGAAATLINDIPLVSLIIVNLALISSRTAAVPVTAVIVIVAILLLSSLLNRRRFTRVIAPSARIFFVEIPFFVTVPRASALSPSRGHRV